MSEIVKSQIEQFKAEILKLFKKEVKDDRAFDYLVLNTIFDVDMHDTDDFVTDGSNDGGIDCLYYDDEEAKLILCQCKYVEMIQYEDIISEFEKMYSTVQNFKRANTGSYNSRLKKALQNAMDRLPEEGVDNIEYRLYTIAPLDINTALKKISNTTHSFATDTVSLYNIDDIEREINNRLEKINVVEEEKIKIDRAKHVLNYESKTHTGIMCNVRSSSLIHLYNKYAKHGLFDLNIRRYIRNKLVDSGIKKTLDSDRENFWFLNNGIIIACESFDVDGDTIRLQNFSIVNGGQTTTLIGEYKGSNKEEFFIPCKIVSTKEPDPYANFFTEIAEATNSQKPIYPRDLKSNAPEMVNLARQLQSQGIYLEIKRGVKAFPGCKCAIKNDELAQLILSFAYQRPGTSRSGKKTIFESNDLYARIFKEKYFSDANKKGFILDIIDLYDRFRVIDKKYKEGQILSDEQLEILKNGQQVIFALLGVIYRLANGDVKAVELQNKPDDLKAVPPTLAAFLSNYKKDDLDKKLKEMIGIIIEVVTEAYNIAYNGKLTTSVSNFLKTDQKYYDNIVKFFAARLAFRTGEEIKQAMDIFKRK